MHIMGVFSIIPVSILLTISFFVLYAVHKTECDGLKKFGRVISVLLWISALMILSMGIYVMITGRHPMMTMCKKMMEERMGCCPMMGQMMDSQKPGDMKKCNMSGMSGKMMKK